jgi:hypothetical protein
MPDRKRNDLPFDSENAAEQTLWRALEALPRDDPQPQLRREFYRQLDAARDATPGARVRGWLGISGNSGWVTVAVCLVVGLAIGQVWRGQESPEPSRLAALEERVAMLNREIILNRLQDASASQRLRGVVDAARLAGSDTAITRALIARASEDRVASVRAAAIDALAPNLAEDSVGNELVRLLENTESPIVQLALVDVILRNGTDNQLAHLLELANSEQLHPDVNAHIRNALGEISI